MDLLQGLLGGDQRQGLEEFAGRYEQGAPWDGVSDEEAVERYRQVARVLPPDEYQDAARQAFERLSPEQRVEFGRYVQQQAHQRGITDFDGDGVDDRFQDAGQLAEMTARAEQRQPGMLEQLIGAVGGGGFGSPGAGQQRPHRQPASRAAVGCWAAPSPRRPSPASPRSRSGRSSVARPGQHRGVGHARYRTRQVAVAAHHDGRRRGHRGHRHLSPVLPEVSAMRKGKAVIGQPIYSVADGVKVESVKDLVLEEGEDGVVALLVSEGGLLSTSTVIPFSSVIRFGPSAVMIDDRSSVIPAASDARVNEILDRRGTLLGTRVVTDDGEDLGKIADLYFDEASGRVTGYEVSGGVLGDAMRGSSYLPFDQIETIGTDAVIAKGAAREVVAHEAARQADAGKSGSPDLDAERERSAGPAGGDPDGSLVGARPTADITARDGSVIVASGQPISLEMIEAARAEDGLDRLYTAAGMAQPGTEEHAAGEALSKAAETASDLWGRFTTKVSDMTDAAGQRMDAQQTKARLGVINDAIGRPVTKVFLDRDDSVILDLGDLVTHQAVQRADEAGLLDSLLACVYKASDVTFTRDEMRAEIAGDSTVDKASGGASVVTDLEEKLAAPTMSDETQEAPNSKSDDPDVGSADGQAGSGDGTPAAAGGTRGAGSSADEPTTPGQTIGQKPDTGTE